MRDNLLKLEQLAIRACDLSKRNIGLSWQDIGEGLKAYNAENSNHQAIQYEGIDVSLFRPAHFKFEARHVDLLNDYVHKIEKIIDSYEKSLDDEAEADRKEKVKTRKESLLRQLKELEDVT